MLFTQAMKLVAEGAQAHLIARLVQLVIIVLIVIVGEVVEFVGVEIELTDLKRPIHLRVIPCQKLQPLIEKIK